MAPARRQLSQALHRGATASAEMLKHTPTDRGDLLHITRQPAETNMTPERERPCASRSEAIATAPRY